MIAILLHLLLTFGGTFFVSPEFTVYPYFISRGLLPYRDLIDQHLPAVFFGPLNFSQLHLTEPELTLALFIAIITATDYLAHFYLRRRLWPTVVFVSLQYLLLSSTLWLESLILLCLVASLYFKRPTAALFLSAAIALKPTLLPFALLIIMFSHRQRWRQLITLGFFPLLEVIWLTIAGLWPQFIAMQRFNAEIYAPLAARSPQIPEMIIFIFALLPTLYFAYRSRKLLQFLLLSLTLLVLIYPRFHLNHLLPFSFLFLYFYTPKINFQPIFIWAILALLLIFGRKFRFSPTNYYYPQSLYQVAGYLSDNFDLRSGIYILGGPDQLYPLTQTLPPDNYYLPSLPWYHTSPKFTALQINALKNHPQAPVIVNTNSRVDGQYLLDYAGAVWNYVNQNYRKIDSVNGLDIYESKLISN